MGYYEDVEVSLGDLPRLVEQVRTLRAQIDSADLQAFLDRLSELIVYAVASGKDLHAIAD